MAGCGSVVEQPCSGTGVIRRHPDIKWLRKASDIETLATLQQQILKNCWSLLKPGGTLLYATCSVLPEENSEQIKRFLANNSDAELINIVDSSESIGWQLLPHPTNKNNGSDQHKTETPSMDGFYYAKLMKSTSG